ncbi:MAG: flagellar motor switch protein FliN [Oligoflexia bacterium]|nr:flagellar motor switch protein FliN [Oligoflexia bacterium]
MPQEKGGSSGVGGGGGGGGAVSSSSGQDGQGSLDRGDQKSGSGVTAGMAAAMTGIPNVEGEKTDEEEEKDLQFIADIPLKLSAELGHIELTIKDLLSLTKGTVLELNKLAGEPLEVYVNDRLVCKGEVVVSGDKYGVRMTDISDQSEDVEIKKP